MTFVSILFWAYGEKTLYACFFACKNSIKTSFLNCLQKYENNIKIEQFVKCMCKLIKIIVNIDAILKKLLEYL